MSPLTVEKSSSPKVPLRQALPLVVSASRRKVSLVSRVMSPLTVEKSSSPKPPRA